MDQKKKPSFLGFKNALIESDDEELEDETRKMKKEPKSVSKKKTSERKPRIKQEGNSNREISIDYDRMAEILKEFHQMKLNLRDLRILLYLFNDSEKHYFSSIKTTMNLENQQIARVLDKLLRFNLILKTIEQNSKISDNRVYYTLTDLGKGLVTKISAF